MSQPTADEILKYRHELFDLEILLRQFQGDIYHEEDSFDTKLVGPAIASAALERLYTVCEWLEKMQKQTSEAEIQEPHQKAA